MRVWRNGGAAFVIGAGMLLVQEFAVMSGVVDGVPAVIAGEIVPDKKSSPSASAKAESNASATASASASVKSAGDQDARCETKAVASANARAGDERVSDYDEQTVHADDESCSASARAAARATHSSQGEPRE